MADTDVRIRLAIPAVDLSGIDALTRKSESLRTSVTALSEDLEDVNKRLKGMAAPGGVVQPAGAQMRTGAAPVQPMGQMTQADAFRQAEQWRSTQRAQDQASARERDEASAKRRESTIQGTPTRVERPRAVAQTPPAPVSQQVEEGRQVRIAGMQQRHIDAAAPQSQAQAAASAQRIAQVGGPLRERAMQTGAPAERLAQLGGPLQQRAIAPTPGQPRTIAQRLAQFGQAIVQGFQGRGVAPVAPTTQAQRIAQQAGAVTRPRPGMREFLEQAGAAPGAPPGGPGDVPVAPGAPPGPTPPPRGGGGGGGLGQAAKGAAGFLGRALIGGGVGAIAGAAIGIIAAPAIQQVTQALEKYEQRVRSVGEMSQTLDGRHQEINATLNTMRDTYKYTIPEATEAIGGLIESGKPLAGDLQKSTNAALGFARAFGVSARAAGQLQGQMERLYHVTEEEGEFPLATMALMQRDRAYKGMTAEQFAGQAMQIGAIGGYNAPAGSTAFGARWTDMISGMGQRFVQNNAAFAQEFAQGLAPGAGGPQSEALRHRALQQLADRLPGGKMVIGKGKEAETLDLRGSFQDRLIAMEQAKYNPEIWEAFAQQGEQLGRNAQEQEELTRLTLAPNMERLTFRKLMRARREQGPEGFRVLLREEERKAKGQGVASEGEPTAADIVKGRIEGMEPVYQKILDVSTQIDAKMEEVGETVLNLKLEAQKGLLNVAEWFEKTFGTAEAQKAWSDMSKSEQHLAEMKAAILGQPHPSLTQPQPGNWIDTRPEEEQKRNPLTSPKTPIKGQWG